MKNILFTIFIFTCFFSFGQNTVTLRANTDRQKVTTYEMSGANLNFQIENDILKQVDIVSGLDAYFGNTDWRTGGGGS